MAGRSARPLLAMGGDWHDLGGALGGDGAPIRLQPLARIDRAGERAWAAEWLAALLAPRSRTVTPDVKEHLWSALSISPPRRSSSGRSPASPCCCSPPTCKHALAALHARRPLGPAARRRRTRASACRCPGLRDRRADRQCARRPPSSPISSTAYRRPLRRPADPDHRRRRLARPRRSSVRRRSSANG